MKLTEITKTDEENPGTYIGLKLDEDSLENVYQLISSLKLDNPISKDNIHVTLIYSPTPAPDAEKLVDPELKHVCTATQYALFGEEEDCLVLKLTGDTIFERHNEMVDQGAQHTYTPYEPHITCSYDVDSININDLPVPDFDIVLTSEYHEPLNLDWKKDNDE